MTDVKISFWFRDLILLLSICFLIFFWGLGATPFYDKHEAREALVSWEMINTGDWILPLRNGVDIPSKPPAFHWLGALVSESLKRVDELTVRFPSALLGTLGIILTYIAGASLWGRSAGLVSALVLSTNFQWWRAATECRVDMTLTFFMLCSFLFFLYIYRTGGSGKKALILGSLLGLATLAKGPLGIVVPSLTALVFIWARRDFPFIKKMRPFAVTSACAIVAGSWYALALWQVGKAFFDVVVSENLQTIMVAHPQPFYFYIPALFLNMAPWSLFLLPVGAFIYHYRHRLAEEAMLYVVVWFVTGFVFFSAFTEKRTVYILPLYPALALLIGVWWQKLKDEPFSSPVFLARLAGYLNAIGFLLVSGMLLSSVIGLDSLRYIHSLLGSKDQAMLTDMTHMLAQHHIAVLAWSAVCGLGGILLISAVWKDAWGAVIGCITAGMVASFFFLHHFEPYLADEFSFKAFMGRVLSVVKDAPLFFYRSPELGTIFYAHRRIPIYQGPIRGEKSPFYLLVWDVEWNQIPDKKGLTVQDTSENVNLTASRKHLFLVAVTKTGRR